MDFPVERGGFPQAAKKNCSIADLIGNRPSDHNVVFGVHLGFKTWPDVRNYRSDATPLYHLAQSSAGQPYAASCSKRFVHCSADQPHGLRAVVRRCRACKSQAKGAAPTKVLTSDDLVATSTPEIIQLIPGSSSTRTRNAGRARERKT
jgi:hypothetical protein